MELALLALAFVITVLLVSSVAERLKLSAPLTLLVVGGLVGYLPFVHVPELTPEFVLVGLLPPLLYSAAVNTSVVDFRANISSIGWLSVGLVLFTAAGVALVLTQILPVGFAVAFAIGAIVAPRTPSPPLPSPARSGCPGASSPSWRGSHWSTTRRRW